jgi:vancomycin resistance protein VanJ
VDGAPLHIFVVHLTPNNLFDAPADQFAATARDRYARRAAETARLGEEVRAVHAPVILLCDCNLTDTSQAYAQLAAFLTDSYREAGWGFGHTLRTASLPIAMQRIDYIWHSDAFVAVAATVGQDGGSDHLPVVVKLRHVP